MSASNNDSLPGAIPLHLSDDAPVQQAGEEIPVITGGSINSEDARPIKTCQQPFGPDPRARLAAEKYVPRRMVETTPFGSLPVSNGVAATLLEFAVQVLSRENECKNAADQALIESTAAYFETLAERLREQLAASHEPTIPHGKKELQSATKRTASRKKKTSTRKPAR